MNGYLDKWDYCFLTIGFAFKDLRSDNKIGFELGFFFTKAVGWVIGQWDILRIKSSPIWDDKIKTQTGKFDRRLRWLE